MPDACKIDPLGQSFHEKPGSVHLETLNGKVVTTPLADKQFYLANYNPKSVDNAQRVVTVFIEGFQTTGSFSAYSKSFLKENLPHAVFTIPGMNGDPNQTKLFTAKNAVESLKAFLSEIPKRLCQPEAEVHLAGFSFGGVLASIIASDSEFLKKSGLKIHGADLISPSFNTYKFALDTLAFDYKNFPRRLAKLDCKYVLAPLYVGATGDDLSIKSYQSLGNVDSQEAKNEILFTPRMPNVAACEGTELVTDGKNAIKNLGDLKNKFVVHYARGDRFVEPDSVTDGLKIEWWNDGHLLVRNHREALTKLIIENLRK